MPTGSGKREKKAKDVAEVEAAAADANLLKLRKTQITTVIEQIPNETVAKALKPQAEHLAIAAMKIETVVIPKLFELYNVVYEFYMKHKHHLEGEAMHDLVPAILGCILCFFGGIFPLLISAVEGFELGGFGALRKSSRELYTQAKAAWEASSKDDEVDDDGDGIPDVNQISSQQLYIRKLTIFAKVVDPAKINDSLSSLATAALSVLAVLKMETARAIALGASLSAIADKQMNVRLFPVLKPMVPVEFQKWVEPACQTVVKIIVCFFAFTIHRIVSAFHSAMRGGHVAGHRIVLYLNRMKHMNVHPDETFLDETIAYSLAAAGFLFQIYMGFRLMFPMNILLFPVSISETGLEIAVSWL